MEINNVVISGEFNYFQKEGVYPQAGKTMAIITKNPSGFPMKISCFLPSTLFHHDEPFEPTITEQLLIEGSIRTNTVDNILHTFVYVKKLQTSKLKWSNY